MREIWCIVFTMVATIVAVGQPKLSFTFDDGSTSNYAGYQNHEWNAMILNHLDAAQVKAMFFVTGNNKTDSAGKVLLKSWDNSGHFIANHTFSHPNFNNPRIGAHYFENQLLKTDSIIRDLEHYTKFFRFPYLKEGGDTVKVQQIRQILRKHGYRNGYVTIDASDWYVNSRLLKALKADSTTNLENFKTFYLQHLYERASFYEDLSFKLHGRHIPHTLLLHHNLAAALFLDDLVDMFQEKGWEIISAHKAYEDPIYSNIPEYAGESLIWALAKDSGKFEGQLRYPAEDMIYEKPKMDALGL